MMKNILFKTFAFGLILMYTVGYAQRDNGTSTNPANPSPSTGVGSNKWDWSSQLTGKGSYNGNGAMYYMINPNSSMYGNYSIPPIQGSPTGIESPYYNSASTQLSQYVAFGTKSDFNWTDGWELITRNFGYAWDETNNAISDATVPYFILYNKFSGTLRVFGVLPTRGGGGNVNSVTVELKFLTSIDNSTYSNYKYSALLGVNGGSNNPDPISGIPYGKAQALDMPTTVNNIAKICPFTGYDNQFFYADFSVGYDPCSCWNQGALAVSFSTNTTGTISLSGRFIGTSQNIADVLNGDNSLPDPIGYLAGVYTQGNNVQAGSLVYKDLQTYADQIYEKANNDTDVNPDLAKDLETFSKIITYAGAILARTDSESSGGSDADTSKTKGFEAMAGVTDFFASLIPEGESAAPTASVIQGEMALKGSLNMNALNPEAFIRFTLPGTPSVPNAPEFYTANNPIPNYPKYNEVLGPFALLQTPSINVSKFHTQYTLVSGGSTNDYYRDEYQITDAIRYIFNPSVHANLSKSVVRAAIELEYIGTAQNPQGFPYPYTFSVRGAKWNYTTELGSNQVNMHYTTDYVDPSLLSNMVIAVENENGLLNHKFNVYLKLLVNLVSNDLKADGVTPNRSFMVFTFPITVQNLVTNNPPNLTGFPFGIMAVDNQNNTCDCVAPDSVILGTRNFSNTNTVYSWGNIRAYGALTASSGIQGQLVSYDGQVYLQPGASMGPGVSMKVGHTIFPANSNSVAWAGTNNLQTWCAGGANSSLPHAYKGSTLGSNIPPTRLASNTVQGTSMDNKKGSIDVYPNPISDISTIKYTVPATGHVALEVYNLMGTKVMDLFEGDQNAGIYSLNIQTNKMETGVYLLSIKAGDYAETQRIVIVK
jgi:hypothetical protein